MNRVDGSLATSRALGDFELKGDPSTPVAQCAQKVSPESEIRIVERDAAADQLLIVACDGIWDVMSDQDVCDIVVRHMGDAKKAALMVVREAYKRRSEDNLTATVIMFPWQVSVSCGRSCPNASSSSSFNLLYSVKSFSRARGGGGVI